MRRWEAATTLSTRRQARRPLTSAACLLQKKLSKRGGIRKKTVDPFTKKDWYSLKAPTFFSQRDLGRTPVNRSQGLSEY
jgi:hypothetical protein